MTTIDPNALTFPPPEPRDFPTCNPQSLLPLQPPPLCIYPPTLPSPPRASLLDTRFALTTHIVPAAFPRTTPIVPLPDLPQWSSDKNAFKASVKRTTDSTLSTKERQWRGELDRLARDERSWWNCVNRYVRKELREAPGGGITLFCAHANGFTKEVCSAAYLAFLFSFSAERVAFADALCYLKIWEPMLERLVRDFSAKSGYQVDEIWSWEAANHGDSSLINRDVLGGICECLHSVCMHVARCERYLQRTWRG